MLRLHRTNTEAAKGKLIYGTHTLALSVNPLSYAVLLLGQLIHSVHETCEFTGMFTDL